MHKPEHARPLILSTTPANGRLGWVFVVIGMGLLVISLAARAELTQIGEGAADAWVLGGLFSLVGLGVALFRRGVMLDQGSGQVVTWWGWLRPLVRSSHMLGDGVHVRLDRSVVETRSRDQTHISRTVVYPVSLRHEHGPSIGLGAPRDLPGARSRAQKVARYLSVELHDASHGEGEAQIWTPDRLGEPLVARLLVEGVSAESLRDAPHPPSGPRPLHVGEHPGGFAVDLTGPGVRFGQLLPLLFLGGVGYVFFRDGVPFIAGVSPTMGAVMTLGTFGVLTALFLLRIVRRAFFRERLKVDRTGVHHTRSGLLVRRGSVHLPAEDIQEVAVSVRSGALAQHAKVLRVRTDDEWIEAGLGLSEDQLAWLRKHTLAAMLPTD